MLQVLTAGLLATLPCALLQDGDILKAAQRGDLERVTALVEEDPARLDARDDRASTPLHLAAGYGRVEVVRWLLDRGVSPDARAGDDATPLHATYDPEVARLLLAAGADLNLRTVLGDPPLMHAARIGNAELVRTIMDAGGQLDLKSALLLGWREEAIELLTANRVPILEEKREEPHRVSFPPIGRAGQPPLRLAASQGDVEILQLLLDRGDEIDVSQAVNFSGEGTALCDAVWAGHEEATRFLLAAGANVHDLSGGHGFQGNLLDYAVHSSSPAMVRILLEGGVPLDEECSRYEGLLHQAAHRGRMEVVEILVEFGADPAGEFDGATPVLLAASAGHGAIVEFLVDQGVPLDWHSAAGLGRAAALTRMLADDPGLLDSKDTRFGRTALMWSIAAGHTDQARTLIQAGAKVDHTGPRTLRGRVFRTPGSRPGKACALSLALDHHDLGALRLLLEAGAQTDGHAHRVEHWPGPEALEALRLLLDHGVRADQPGLLIAVASRFEEPETTVAMIDLLLERGADLEQRDEEGWTALMSSVYRPDEVSRALLQRGAAVDFASACALGETEEVRRALAEDPELARSPFPFHPRDARLYAARRGHVDVVRLLVEASPPTEEELEQVVVAAADHGHLALIQYLLSIGFDADARIGSHDRTLLHHAAGSEAGTALVEFLIEQGLDVNVGDLTGGTPLHSAASWGSAETVVTLLRLGADPLVTDRYGMTALHDVSSYGGTDGVAKARVLIAAGVDPTARNRFGETPYDHLHTWIFEPDPKLVEFLESLLRER